MSPVSLVLHSHLPWVLHHGRWPHGSDWLCEAALDTYLPLLAMLDGLAADDVPAELTIGVTPVLANMLAHADFRGELTEYLDRRIAACDAAPTALATTRESHLVPVASAWGAHYRRLQAQFAALDGDLIAALRRHADAGRIELLSSAATHGFLPLLGCDESLHLQLQLGQAEHRRLFGRAAAGCWMPECAYRPFGRWEPVPGAPGAGMDRPGIEHYVTAAGFRFAFVDAHLVAGGTPLGASGGTTTAARDAAGRRATDRVHVLRDRFSRRELRVLARNRRLSSQVWSRYEGYPGDPRYLEFHKQSWHEGLKLWAVSAPGTDLGAKQPYVAAAAAEAARAHADHFAALARTLAQALPDDGVLCVPFDTELFGHWWFEGPAFLGAACRAFARPGGPSLRTAGRMADAPPTPERIALPEGTWGANGDFSMWWGPQTAWTWQRLWPLERRFWTVARRLRDDTAAHRTLAQAARALLLAQSSDWQFIISTGEAGDYASQRFANHCADLAALLDAIDTGDRGVALADEQHRRDDCFPHLLDTLLPLLHARTA